MKSRILAFGIAKEIFASPEIVTELPENATVQDLRLYLEERYPRLKQLVSYRVARNNVFADNAEPLVEQDEIAIIPPVSGG